MKPLLIQIDMVMSNAEAGEELWIGREKGKRRGNTVCPQSTVLTTPRE